MEEQKYVDISGTITSPGGTVSGRITTVDPEPPEKPPRYKRLRERFGGWFEATVIGFVINQLPSVDWTAAWEATQKFLQRYFGRKRQPAEAEKFDR